MEKNITWFNSFGLENQSLVDAVILYDEVDDLYESWISFYDVNDQRKSSSRSGPLQTKELAINWVKIEASKVLHNIKLITIHAITTLENV